MKKSLIFLLTYSLSLGFVNQSDAVALRIDSPNVVFSNQQAIPVVIVDSNGNTYEQTVYYNPGVGGIEINANWAGPNASIYIPSLNTGYLWYNGFWIDQEGYYWDGGRKAYLNDPQWRNHWTGYWHSGGHGHDRWRRDGWRDKDRSHWRHDNERDNRWNDKGHGKWDDGHGKDFDKDQHKDFRAAEYRKGEGDDSQRRDINQSQRQGMPNRGFDRGFDRGQRDNRPGSNEHGNRR